LSDDGASGVGVTVNWPSRATICRFGNDREETRYAATRGPTTTNRPMYIHDSV
jgi:esterase/lipase superfamily enzyme